jgi:ribosomal protein S18 acetylase RimI-like enzyme
MNKIERATVRDAAEILSLQKIAYISEAEIYENHDIEPLKQNLEDIEKAFESNIFLKIVENENIIGSVKATKKNGICYIGKLMVHPNHQNKGIGKKLMQEIESLFPNTDFELFTGSKSYKNISFYEKLGYKGFKYEKSQIEDTVFLFMRKRH